MFDHIQLKVKDLKASKRFYTAALAPLGFTVQYEGDAVVGFGPKGAPALWLADGESRGTVHIAFAGEGPGYREGILCRRSARRRQGQWRARPQAVGIRHEPAVVVGMIGGPNNIEAVCHQEE
jgi:catechol 2,3-dioxygenase-like lactoylglutathione lyase family enzyme